MKIKKALIKSSIIVSIVLCGMLNVGCIDKESDDKGIEDTYAINISNDNKEHSFDDEKVRPIIKVFCDINQSLSPDEIKALFSKLGKTTESNIYTKDSSEYEMFNLSAVNKKEEVLVTFKDGTLISKRYKKDISDVLNRNLAFVNYESKLFNTEYSSGIIDDMIDNNIAKDMEVWELEGKFFEMFNDL